MFGIPGKQAVTLTPAAARQIARLMEKNGTAGLRIGVKKGGCAGMEYTMEWAEDQKPFDEVVEDKGVRVLIDPKAVMFLIGTEMDFQEEKFKSGFTFNNPNEKARCGCGESFTV